MKEAILCTQADDATTKRPDVVLLITLKHDITAKLEQLTDEEPIFHLWMMQA